MKWIVNNWKAIGIIALIIAACAGVWIAIYFYHQWQAEKQKNNLVAASKSNFKEEPVKQFTDTAGHHHYAVSADHNSFNESTIKDNPSISLGGADTAALALQIQRDQIQYWMSVATESKAVALKAKSQRDSMGKIVRYYESKFIKLAYHPGKDSTDNGTFDYTKYEQYQALQYWKRTHFLGKRQSFVDITSMDPNTVVTGVNTFNVQPDPNPFTLRAQVNSSYDFANGRYIPSAGIIGTYKNWEFSYKYYYSHQFHKLEPIAAVAYDLWLR